MPKTTHPEVTLRSRIVTAAVACLAQDAAPLQGIAGLPQELQALTVLDFILVEAV